MGVIGVDLTALPEGVRKRMGEIWSRENEMAMVQAKIRQEKIAKFYADNAPRWKDGFGPMVMAIDPYWRDYFSMLHSGQVWDEKDFREWLMKQEPMFRVKAESPRVQVGYAGPGESDSPKRKFRKEYLTAKNAKGAER